MYAGAAAEAMITYHGRIDSPSGNPCQPATRGTKNRTDQSIARFRRSSRLPVSL